MPLPSWIVVLGVEWGFCLQVQLSPHTCLSVCLTLTLQSSGYQDSKSLQGGQEWVEPRRALSVSQWQPWIPFLTVALWASVSPPCKECQCLCLCCCWE